VFFLERLISRSSRSLAVMIGFVRSAQGTARKGVRGSPDAARNRLIPRPPSRSTAANPG
jgi:hypothetical protein